MYEVALQMQAVDVTLAAADVEPAGHAEQATEPTVSLKKFATHAVQTLPSAPVYPALH